MTCVLFTLGSFVALYLGMFVCYLLPWNGGILYGILITIRDNVVFFMGLFLVCGYVVIFLIYWGKTLGYLGDVVRAAQGRACAVIIECVQGESGVNALPKDFVQELARWCSANDVLLICDEVQCGNGRCGTLYAYEQYGIAPDIVTTAKGLAGGLPIGACLFFERAQDAFSAGDHGSTFGGNPVSCAAAVNVISRLTPEFLLEVQGKAAYLRAKLKGFDGVKAVTGLGMMIGLVLEKNSKQVAAACLEKGLLVLTAHERLRIVPPLTITKTEMDEGLSVLKEVLK